MSLLKSLRSLIAKLLIIIAIVALMAYGFDASITILDITIKGAGWIYLALGSFALAFILDGETASKVMGSVTDAAKSIVSSAGEVLGSALSSVISSTGIGNILLLAGGAFVGYKLFVDNSSTPQTIEVKTE